MPFLEIITKRFKLNLLNSSNTLSYSLYQSSLPIINLVLSTRAYLFSFTKSYPILLVEILHIYY